MPLPAQSIGNWSVQQLVRFVKDMLKNEPAKHFPYLSATTALFTGDVSLRGKIILDGDPGWQTVGGNGMPAFTNAWVSWGSPYAAAGYWRDPLGFVHLRGVLKTGTVGSSAFMLPPGYRPASSKVMAVLSNNAIGRLDIGSDGTVTPQLPSSNVFVALDGLLFSAV